MGAFLNLVNEERTDHILTIEDPIEVLHPSKQCQVNQRQVRSHTESFARALRAGMVYVNCYDADDITVPFGGFKQSGIGRDKSLHAFDKYTELKTTWIDLSQ